MFDTGWYRDENGLRLVGELKAADMLDFNVLERVLRLTRLIVCDLIQLVDSLPEQGWDTNDGIPLREYDEFKLALRWADLFGVNEGLVSPRHDIPTYGPFTTDVACDRSFEPFAGYALKAARRVINWFVFEFERAPEHVKIGARKLQPEAHIYTIRAKKWLCLFGGY